MLMILYIIYLTWLWLPFMFIHRSLTHNQCTFSPVLIAVVKIIVWTTRFRYHHAWMATWVAVHIKHHAYVDTEQDPHSPYYNDAISIILNRGIQVTEEDIQRITASYIIPVTSLDYRLEKMPYGPWVLLAVFTPIFGLGWGLLLWVLCINTLLMAGFFNYANHCFPGYNNQPSTTSDKSRNVFFLGFIFGGEPLHGNHHRWPSRANLAMKWWEFDLGFWILKFLSLFKLVTFKK